MDGSAPFFSFFSFFEKMVPLAGQGVETATHTHTWGGKGESAHA
jgi:hypothetical protein